MYTKIEVERGDETERGREDMETKVPKNFTDPKPRQNGK